MDKKVDKYIFAIRLYSSIYFKFINQYLREEGKVVKDIKINGRKLTNLTEDQLKSWAKCLQNALKTYKIKKVNFIKNNTIVFRGIKKCRFPKNLGIGSGFYFTYFISTSLKEEFSLRWVNGEGTLLKITIRNNGIDGHPNYCQYIDSLSVSNKEPQYEVLLAPNCFYRITNIIRREKIDYVTLVCEGILS